MTVPRDGDDSRHVQFSALVLALISAFAPACYTPSWEPWLRWVSIPVVLVVLVLVIYLVTGALLLPVPLR